MSFVILMSRKLTDVSLMPEVNLIVLWTWFRRLKESNSSLECGHIKNISSM